MHNLMLNKILERICLLSFKFSHGKNIHAVVDLLNIVFKYICTSSRWDAIKLVRQSLVKCKDLLFVKVPI